MRKAYELRRSSKVSGVGKRKRIVIVGAGFGGIAAARALKRAEADILLIDRTNHHLFQPLLYQGFGEQWNQKPT